MTIPTGPSAIVVGAGIVGAACAEALADAGCAVRVFESGFAGSGATSRAMGHLVVMDDSPAQLALTAWSRRLWAARAPGLPARCEDDPCGTLWIAADDEEMALVRSKATLYASHGEDVEVLDGGALRDAEPSLRRGLAGGLRVPADRVVYPPSAVRLLLDRARGFGADVKEGSPVETMGPGRVRAGGEWHEADLVVNAAGLSAPGLTPGLAVEPRKGHLVITDPHPGFLRHQVIELRYLKSAHTLTRESVAFNVQPRKTGQLLVGSSRELVGWDASVNRPLVARMLERATSYLPDLGAVGVLRTWTGFRPATPDALPLIGEWEPGLYVAAGHEGLGVTTSLGTARLLADLALGRAPAIDPAPYHPRRAAAAHA